eukprot:CAMPEP_0197628986 /NCGR_PEP_ID=MMETSP1338-20131121/7042_1 /TAXON_ID=43686 ORGANISM="Pelagodinium beii, Strain RCC1491" /NCGR_SAMPLE_ID=MMETSP1338 /ASSEMBLY_ACC=CAM_ASM_000754 /LENGTH=153 /DNA_ID=CAMNT_0043199993 /DNA_START=83 /DNA_END=544 /DNA_ORIENTATION=+
MSYGWGGNQWGNQWGGKGGYGMDPMMMGGYGYGMGYGMDPMMMGKGKGKGGFASRSRGKACVEFSSASAARAAMQTLDGSSLDGRQIKVSEWTGGKSPNAQQGDPECKVYIANLNWKTQGWKLKEHMSSVGDVVYAKVIADKDPMAKGWGKGW